MNPQVATAAYVLLILGLFWLDRDRKVRVPTALWIPALWLLINGSRPVSAWFNQDSTTATDGLEGSPLDATVFGILLVCAVGVLVWRRRRTVRFLRANGPALLFFAYCAISVLWADYSFIALKRWTKAVGDLAVLLVVVTDLNPTVAIQRVLSRMSFILLPLSVLFIKYYPEIGRSYNQWTWLPNLGGVTLFKNLLGETCLIAGLGSVWSLTVAYRERKGQDRLRHMAPHVIIVGIAIYLFLTADSMTSFSCFMFGTNLIVLTNISWIRRKPAAVHLLIGATITLALCAVFLPGANLVESIGRDSSLTGRTEIWAAVISVVKNPLLGAGFESFWTGERLPTIWRIINEPGIQEAHNGYLEVYLNLGWIGVTLLATLIVTGYRNVITSFRRDRKAGTIRLAFFVVGLIFCFTEAGFRMMSMMWIAFLLSTLAVPTIKLRKERPQASDELTGHDPAETGAACEDAIAAI
jgi:exopolysaccharide production protein ExoQ